MKQIKITPTITNRSESHTLERYFTEVSRIEMLTPDEEVELTKRIKKGDQVATDKLVKANLRFVISVAKQYQSSNIPLNDLISEGNYGLIKAALKFDETRGFKFISYAVWWIRQSIIQSIQDQGKFIRLPSNKQGVISKLLRRASELEQQLERQPTPDELAEYFEMKGSDIQKLMTDNLPATSVFNTVSAGEDQILLDTLQDSESSDEAANIGNADSLKTDLARLINSKLNDKEKTVINMHYGLADGNEYTLESISDVLNISRERVRQIKEKAILKLKSKNESYALKEYF